MLDIVLFVLTSPHADLPISPSTNQVRSVAISNVDGVTPNHLLQQMYKTQVLDEDVDLELSDEELESVVAQHGNVNSAHSDVFYRGSKIIDYGDFSARRLNHHQQIDYICNQLPAPIDKNCCLNPQKRSCHERQRRDRQIAGVISDQIRAQAPVAIKYRRGGLNVNLSTGQVTYRR